MVDKVFAVAVKTEEIKGETRITIGSNGNMLLAEGIIFIEAWLEKAKELIKNPIKDNIRFQ